MKNPKPDCSKNCNPPYHEHEHEAPPVSYDELLKNAPEHDSLEFLDYLRANNKVVAENSAWLIIQNVKYPWLTAFAKDKNPRLRELPSEYWSWEWKKKPADKQTVKRFHLHLIPPPQSTGECGTDGKTMWCYCGKCEQKSYPLPKDFPLAEAPKWEEDLKAILIRAECVVENPYSISYLVWTSIIRELISEIKKLSHSEKVGYARGYKVGFESGKMDEIEESAMSDVPLVLKKVDQIRAEAKKEEREALKRVVEKLSKETNLSSDSFVNKADILNELNK